MNTHLEAVTDCEQIGEHDGELSLRADGVNTHLETVTDCEQIGEHDGEVSLRADGEERQCPRQTQQWQKNSSRLKTHSETHQHQRGCNIILHLQVTYSEKHHHSCDIILH